LFTCPQVLTQGEPNFNASINGNFVDFHFGLLTPANRRAFSWTSLYMFLFFGFCASFASAATSSFTRPTPIFWHGVQQYSCRSIRAVNGFLQTLQILLITFTFAP
jgi:hypothetical protein